MLLLCSPTWFTQPPTTSSMRPGVDLVAVEGAFQGEPEQVGRVPRGQCALALADRRPHRVDDDGFVELRHARRVEPRSAADRRGYVAQRSGAARTTNRIAEGAPTKEDQREGRPDVHRPALALAGRRRVAAARDLGSSTPTSDSSALRARASACATATSRAQDSEEVALRCGWWPTAPRLRRHHRPDAEVAARRRGGRGGRDGVACHQHRAHRARRRARTPARPGCRATDIDPAPSRWPTRSPCSASGAGGYSPPTPSTT